MEYISLGSSCSVAYQLQKNNKRNCAYPFDWVRTNKLDDITNVIENNFNEYIESCKKINESYSYPISNNNDFPTISNNNNKVSIIMKNKYNIKFYHDFDSDIIEDKVIQKYNRRINRFMDIIKSNKTLYFIRDELNIKNINIKSIEKFIDIIHNINSNIKFKLIIILHNINNKKHELLEYNNKNVYIINDNNEFGDWIRPNVDWLNIFNFILKKMINKLRLIN